MITDFDQQCKKFSQRLSAFSGAFQVLAQNDEMKSVVIAQSMSDDLLRELTEFQQFLLTKQGATNEA